MYVTINIYNYVHRHGQNAHNLFVLRQLLTLPGTCCVVHISFEPIETPMPWCSGCWDYRHELLCLARCLLLYENAMCVYSMYMNAQ